MHLEGKMSLIFLDDNDPSDTLIIERDKEQNVAFKWSCDEGPCLILNKVETIQLRDWLMKVHL